MFDELVKIYDARIELEKSIKEKKREFQESITSEEEKLSELKILENKLREEIYETLKKNKETAIEYDNKIISRNEKKTIQIIDEEALYKSLQDNAEKIQPLTNIDIDSLLKVGFAKKLTIIEKPIIMDIINAYNKVEGRLLEGLEEKITPFITIKNK